MKTTFRGGVSAYASLEEENAITREQIDNAQLQAKISEVKENI